MTKLVASAGHVNPRIVKRILYQCVATGNLTCPCNFVTQRVLHHRLVVKHVF